MESMRVKSVNPVAPYIGGKRNLARTIVGRIAAIEHRTYVEPFVGMGGVFLRRPERARSEVINDINRDLVTFYRVLQNHYVAFLEHVKFDITSRAAFEREQGKLIDADRAEQTVFARAKAERDAHIAWVQRSAPIMASELGIETGPVFTVLDRLMREHLEHLLSTPLGGLFHADGE